MAAPASVATDLDQKLIKKVMVLLHSSHPDSAAELRRMLDEAIKQRYGADKMISNTMLTPRLLELEKNFPGRATTPQPEPEKPAEAESAADEVINLTNSPPPVKTISDSPETTMVVDSDDEANVGAGTTGGMSTITGGEDDGNLKEFGDLNCCVCAEMMFTATNRLIECSKCGALYHQECHKPPITDEEVAEQEHNWQCDACFNKPSTSKAAGIVVIPDEPISLISKTSATSSRSSSSSNSSSPYYKQEAAAIAPASAISTTATTSLTSSTTGKHHHKSSSSSSSKSHKEKEERSTKSTASEKSSSTHTSRKSSHSSKSSSSKSSSKHHESSTKRKSQK